MFERILKRRNYIDKQYDLDPEPGLIYIINLFFRIKSDGTKKGSLIKAAFSKRYH